MRRRAGSGDEDDKGAIEKAVDEGCGGGGEGAGPLSGERGGVGVQLPAIMVAGQNGRTL